MISQNFLSILNNTNIGFMVSPTLFLQPTNSSTATNSNFVTATGNAVFSNYSQTASGSLTNAELNLLINGGVANAITDANATFSNNPTFTSLFTEASATAGQGELFEVESESQTQVIATFDVNASQTFSFDFSANLEVEGTEINNESAEYEGNSKTSFLILDTSNIYQVKVLDYFGLSGELISSSTATGEILSGATNVNFSTLDQDKDIGGNNGTDVVSASAAGTYERTFNSNTEITVVEMNSSFIQLSGDGLIDQLGPGVTYGGIWDDQLFGGSQPDKIYASLGNDLVRGGNSDDILEGGDGNDQLYGEDGNDKLHGGLGADTLEGGSSQDLLEGGEGNDLIKGNDGDDTLNGGAGQDTLNGGSSQDLLNGNGGNDVLEGENGDDTLNGEGGNDLLKGGEHQDQLNGGNGRDTLYGNNGDDRLNGGNLNDVLYGDNGNDILTGGSGSDQMHGGNGNDAFVFEQGSSFLSGEFDVIKDFQVGTDRVEFHNFGNIDPLSQMTNSGSGAILTLNTGGELLFEGLTVSQLNQANFTVM